MGLSTIQWCRYTFNAWLGCRKVAPECQNCYITSTPTFKFRGLTHGPVRVRTAESTWKQPLAWNRKAAREGVRERVFSLSLGDWLDDENVPIEWFADLLWLVECTPCLDWLLLTKRPQNWGRRLMDAEEYLKSSHKDYRLERALWIHQWLTGKAPHNVWIGVSAGADQAAALEIPARIHFLSCEPMLRPLDTTHAARFDWIIFGGESGKHSRPTDIEWIRAGLKFCRTHNVAPFIKQMGAHLIHEKWPKAEREFNNFGRIENFDFKDSHGGDIDEWPEDLRVREFPTPR